MVTEQWPWHRSPVGQPASVVHVCEVVVLQWHVVLVVGLVVLDVGFGGVVGPQNCTLEMSGRLP